MCLAIIGSIAVVGAFFVKKRIDLLFLQAFLLNLPERFLKIRLLVFAVFRSIAGVGLLHFFELEIFQLPLFGQGQEKPQMTIVDLVKAAG